MHENEDLKILQSFNYQQELKRTIKLFGSFAVAFSFISITTGIFTNYQFVITTGGPAGIWAWPFVAIGQLLVGLVFAELAGVIPLTGYSYQWVRRLATPGLGWFVGWMSFCFLILVIPAVDMGMAPVLAGLLGIEINHTNIVLIVLITMAIQSTLNIIGVKLASQINNAAVFTETVGIIGLTIFLAVAAFRNDADVSILFNTGGVAESGSYLGAFLLSALMGAFTLVGFEAAANLSEETIEAHKTVPKAVISSLAISGLFGTLYLIFATLAIPDLAAVMASNNPLPYIIEANLGNIVGKLFLVLVVISIFACGLVITTSGGRLIYAMSRDDVFFASSIFKKVNSNGSPAAATLLLLVFGIIATLFSDSLTLLVGATSVLPALIYLFTVVSYGVYRKNVVFRKDSFNMGKWHQPVLVSATLWLVIEIGILTMPKQFHEVTIVSGLMLLVGIVCYYAFFRKKLMAVSEINQFPREEISKSS